MLLFPEAEEAPFVYVCFVDISREVFFIDLLLFDSICLVALICFGRRCGCRENFLCFFYGSRVDLGTSVVAAIVGGAVSRAPI